MATLILTAVGSAIGGPIGGAIGAALGQQADRALFGPKAREGVRLKELAVQTSSYGTPIPAIFGAMRVAGTVIWATDLVERRVKSGGSKGRPATVNYSYSVSMAVAISSRPIVRIGRIWADGNLIRGQAGDLKVDTQLRIYLGDADQSIDPLMASAENPGACPAHRGIAYVMFEDLQLADFGNRIPSLTFELFEREGAVPLHDIFQTTSAGEILGQAGHSLEGFAVGGSNVREVLAPLLDAFPVELRTDEGQMSLRDSASGSVPAAVVTAALSENSESFGLPMQIMPPPGQMPVSVSLRYYDSSRDYQAGLQSSEHRRSGRTAIQVELPAVLDAGTARRLAENKAMEAHYCRGEWSGNISVSSRRLAVGDRFADQHGQIWKVDEVEHRLGTIAIKARNAVVTSGATNMQTAPGRHLSTPDLLAGETRVALVEFPIIEGIDAGKPLLAAFASGTHAGWRRAGLAVQTPSGLMEIGSTAAPAVMGVTLSALGPHSTLLIDENTQLEIELFNDSMDIASRDGAPVDADAPYFWIGGEFVRVGKVEKLDAKIYRLSRLQRGCFSQSMFIPDHGTGSMAVLVEQQAARLINERSFARGEFAQIEAMGLSDLHPVLASATVQALATNPLAPVHGVATRSGDGSILLEWKRRSRIDLGWVDGVDQALGEDREAYAISLEADGAGVGQWNSSESRLQVSGAEIAALNLVTNSPLSFSVRQIGRFAQSDPLVINVI